MCVVLSRFPLFSSFHSIFCQLIFNKLQIDTRDSRFCWLFVCCCHRIYIFIFGVIRLLLLEIIVCNVIMLAVIDCQWIHYMDTALHLLVANCYAHQFSNYQITKSNSALFYRTYSLWQQINRIISNRNVSSWTNDLGMWEKWMCKNETHSIIIQFISDEES